MIAAVIQTKIGINQRGITKGVHRVNTPDEIRAARRHIGADERLGQQITAKSERLLIAGDCQYTLVGRIHPGARQDQRLAA